MAVRFTYQGMKKSGEIVATIPPNTFPGEVLSTPITQRMYKPEPRNYESFLIESGGKFYWPRIEEML